MLSISLGSVDSNPGAHVRMKRRKLPPTRLTKCYSCRDKGWDAHIFSEEIKSRLLPLEKKVVRWVQVESSSRYSRGLCPVSAREGGQLLRCCLSASHDSKLFLGYTSQPGWLWPWVKVDISFSICRITGLIPSIRTPCSPESHLCKEADCLLSKIRGDKTFSGRTL